MTRSSAKRNLTIIAAGAAAVTLSAAAGINALANYWRLENPDAALRLRPADSVALTFHADRRASETGTLENPRDVERNARTALSTDPLTAPALRQLAVAEDGKGRSVQAHHLLDLAHKLSRREPGTTWLLINDSLDRGDIRPMLRYFDEALTTASVSPDIIYPALTAGLFDPALRAGLAPYMRRERPWLPELFRYAASSPQTAADAVRLIVEQRGLPDKPAYAGISGALLTALADGGNFALARAYIAQSASPGQNDIAADPRFSAPTMDDVKLGAFAWRFTDQVGMSVSPDNAGGLQLQVAPNKLGIVATRYLTVTPGHYVFSYSISTPADQPVADIGWQLDCMSGQSIALLSQRPATRRGGLTYREDIDIPSGCIGLKLSLSALSRVDSGDSAVTVGKVALRKS